MKKVWVTCIVPVITYSLVTMDPNTEKRQSIKNIPKYYGTDHIGNESQRQNTE